MNRVADAFALRTGAFARRIGAARGFQASVVASVIAIVLAAGAVALFATPADPASPATSCENLTRLTLPDTTITSAVTVPAGPFRAPSGGRGNASPPTVPAFCRVTGVTKPAVNFETWLPIDNWNGRFQGVGNGGTAGVIGYPAMVTALNRGYAVAGTDTGHVNNPAINFDSTWALGHPELVADFGHRGLHVTTVNGKAITGAFYDKPPDHSYYVGCSKGGQMGLMEAQRYPEDYDGLIAGDPANNWTRFYAGGHLWYSLATLKDPDSYIPADKIPLLGDAVNAACDKLDGIADGVINDPRQCKFDPAVLTCTATQDPATCFTSKQVTAIKAIWSGAHNSKGQLIYPGLVPGGEAGPGGWAAWTTGTAPFKSTHFASADGFFKYMVFQNPNWDFRTFNYDTDVPAALEKVSGILDATNPDLRPLRARGGKLIVYHGWSDPDISPLNSINYYEQAAATVGESTPDFFRLFLVPGMQHCSGGPGPSQFDALTALERWVEHGIAPDTVIASHVTAGKVDRTRPLCAYPKVAKWTGTGSTDEAANFACVMP